MIRTEFENSSACLLGAGLGSNHEKYGGRKSRDTLPLTYRMRFCDFVRSDRSYSTRPEATVVEQVLFCSLFSSTPSSPPPST